MGGDRSTMDTLLSRPHQEKNTPRSELWVPTWERRDKRSSRIGKACARRGDEEVEGRPRKDGEKEKGKTQGRRKEKSRRLGVGVVIIALCGFTMSDIKRGRWYKEPRDALKFLTQLGGTRRPEGEKELGWAGGKGINSGGGCVRPVWSTVAHRGFGNCRHHFQPMAKVQK